MSLLFSLQAQNWNGTTPGDIYYNSGNVGIGISTPTRDLHIRGTNNVVQVDRNSHSPSVGLTRYSPDWTTVYKSFHIAVRADAAGNGQFQIIDQHQQVGGTGDTRFVIDNAGRVGVGTTDPLAPFHVRAGSKGALFESTANGRKIEIDPGSGFIDIQNATLNLNRFASNNISLAAGGGNVGIGTGIPSTKLEIFGAPNTTAVILNNENFIGFKRADGALVYGMGHTNSEFTIGATANLGPTAGTPIHITAGSSSAQIRFSQNTHERMRIASNGYVGIGTTSPDAELTVKGDIHAEEVRVDLNVPGPDYVFEEDYDLPTLESLQNYIRENKHLPEVPSAAEMQANGIDVGVMNMLLLKKVEELTLHLIEQNQEMEQLRKEFETFKTQKQ